VQRGELVTSDSRHGERSPWREATATGPLHLILTVSPDEKRMLFGGGPPIPSKVMHGLARYTCGVSTSLDAFERRVAA